MTENNKPDTLVKEIKNIMIKQGYVEVTKELYHKQKKKVKHGVWKIDKKYYYFLKDKKENSFFEDWNKAISEEL